MEQSFIWLYEAVGTITLAILIVYILIKIMKYME